MEERKCAVCEGPNTRTKATCSTFCARELQNRSLPEKTCPFPDCRKAFAPKSPRAKYCSPRHDVTCEECGKEQSVLSASRSPFYCSSCKKKDAIRRRIETVKNRSEDEKKAIREKVEATNLERYGVRRPMQSEEIKKKSVQTNLERYGAEHASKTESFQASRKATNLEKYGVEHPSQNEEVKAKTIATNQERYGADHFLLSDESKADYQEKMLEKYGVISPMHTPEARAKAQATNKEKYGGVSPFSSEAVRSRIRSTIFERYGKENYAQTEEFLTRMREWNKKKYGSDFYFGSDAHQKALRDWSLDLYGVAHPLAADAVRAKIKATVQDRYGVDHVMRVPEIVEKMQKSREKTANEVGIGSGLISKLNREFAEELETTFGVEVKFEKALSGASFDLEIEGSKVLIDLNPTVTHNGAVAFGCLLKACAPGCDKHKKIPRSYHYDRARIARSEGYSLIQVYDWDDRDSILRLIGGKIEADFTRHSARKLTLKKITQKAANKFLKLNHVQGGARSQSHCYGLFADNELLAVATFGSARFGAKEEYEWVRYAVKEKTIIHGGAGRLWKTFIEDANPSSVISYVDYNHTTAPTIFLNSLGFFEDSPTGPNLNWHNSRTRKRVPETSLLRLGADRLLGTSYGSREESGLNNHDIMVLEGFLPIWTAGNRVFRWAQSDSA